VLFRPADQVRDLKLFPFIRHDRAVITPEHLVHLAAQDGQIGFGIPVKEGGEYQVDALIRGFHRPGFHEVLV